MGYAWPDAHTQRGMYVTACGEGSQGAWREGVCAVSADDRMSPRHKLTHTQTTQGNNTHTQCQAHRCTRARTLRGVAGQAEAPVVGQPAGVPPRRRAPLVLDSRAEARSYEIGAEAREQHAAPERTSTIQMGRTQPTLHPTHTSCWLGAVQRKKPGGSVNETLALAHTHAHTLGPAAQTHTIQLKTQGALSLADTHDRRTRSRRTRGGGGTHAPQCGGQGAQAAPHPRAKTGSPGCARVKRHSHAPRASVAATSHTRGGGVGGGAGVRESLR